MNYSTVTPRHSAHRRQTLEARFGLRAVSHLSAASEQLPHDVTERLRVARDVALARAQAKKQGVAQPTVSMTGATVNADGTLSRSLFGGTPDQGDAWWIRLSALVPLLLLVVGLLVIHDWERHQQIHATADIDTALLSDPLPPEAYTDPGFDEFLRSMPESAAAQ